MAETTGDTADLPARLDALRASGAADCDPVRFAYFEALSRRAAIQAEPIRQLLLAKLNALADELATRPAATPKADTPAASPLADLLAYISQQAHAHPDAMQPLMGNPAVNRKFEPKSKSTSAGGNRQAPELKSVAFFRNELSKLSTEQQLTQTLAQAPENAGPMNSQHLVLRALQVMRDVSPDYLQGFMSYIDALIWLDYADPTKVATSRTATADGEKKPRTTTRNVTKR